jgi:hypothetical protein
MAKRLIIGARWMVVAGLALSLVSCAGSQGSAPRKITYKCLSSSCDATVTCNEGDPVPEHCGKRMIR